MDVCSEKHKQIDKQFETNNKRLNNHGERIDVLEREFVGQQKDTMHLEKAIISLQKSIDKLIKEINSLKSKPLEKYEQIAMVIISAIFGALITWVFKELI